MSCHAHDKIQEKYSCQRIRKRPKNKLKVTKLLEKSFEKYQNIGKVGSAAQEPKISPPNNKVEKSCAVEFEGGNGKKRGIRNVTCKRFSKEEDEIIMEAFTSAGISELKKAPPGFISDLSGKMKRNVSSIYSRYTYLKTKNTRIFQVRFTLLDDKAIIDAATENIKRVGSLSKSSIDDKNEIADRLRRNKQNVISRWLYKLKPWIMRRH